MTERPDAIAPAASESDPRVRQVIAEMRSAVQLSKHFGTQVADSQCISEWADQLEVAIASHPALLAALKQLLAEPYGCTLCDSGTPRNAAKGHQPDCPYERARSAVAEAERA